MSNSIEQQLNTLIGIGKNTGNTDIYKARKEAYYVRISGEMHLTSSIRIHDRPEVVVRPLEVPKSIIIDSNKSDNRNTVQCGFNMVKRY